MVSFRALFGGAGRVKASSKRGSRVSFGQFELDLFEERLLKRGVSVRLENQPFQILAALLEHPGEVVSREELRSSLWSDGTYVDFDEGLNTAIKKLRYALGDSAEHPIFIETIPRRGYRFIAPMSGNRSAQTVAELDLAAVPKTQRSRRSLKIGIALALAAVALSILLLSVVPSKFGWRRSGASAAPQIRSLAVLPLRNLSADPTQEYFSEAMTDALITDLASIDSLKVISRTSSMQYKDTRKSLPEIAHELSVDGIVEGTVQRSGDRVRITAQLIYGPSDKHLWANTYEGDMRDGFTLERDVTEDIAHQIQARLTTKNRSEHTQPLPMDPKALEAYLQGNYHLNKQGAGFGDEEKRGLPNISNRPSLPTPSSRLHTPGWRLRTRTSYWGRTRTWQSPGRLRRQLSRLIRTIRERESHWLSSSGCPIWIGEGRRET